MNNTNKITPVILSGGSGTRLWPVSRDALPKQFCKTDGQKSLFQMSLLRVGNKEKFNAPIIVANARHASIITTQMLEIDIEPQLVINEPVGRDTAPAIALAVQLNGGGSDEVMAVLPSDHLVQDEQAFDQALFDAAHIAAHTPSLVTLGIKPAHAETGFGYLRAGKKIRGSNAFELESFIEKPCQKDADNLITQDDVFWNAGIFVFNAVSIRKEFSKHAGLMNHAVMNAIDCGDYVGNSFTPNADIFGRINPISFDYAIMEKTEHAAMVPTDPKWSDLGSWKAVWETSDQDAHSNVVQGEVYCEDTNYSLMISNGPAIAVSGLEDVIVVADRDAVLVTSRDNPQGVKALVSKMRDNQSTLVEKHKGEVRPWGSFDSLHNGEKHQVKHIRVVPGGQLSLQYHHHRAEHWVVVSGVATVTVDDEVQQLSPCQQIFIPQGAVHRLENFTDEPVDIIEVQYGTYLGEDDIVRVEDIYGRDEVETPKINAKVA